MCDQPIPEPRQGLYSYLFFLLCMVHWSFFPGLLEPRLVSAAHVSFQWDGNTEPDLAGYRIHYGTSSGIYPFSIDVGHITCYTLSGLDEGHTYYFALTAYNIQGVHSAYSIELSKYFPELDTDQDGLPDNDEISIYNTDPNNPDTDGDGINDGDEVNFWGPDWNMDFDNDGQINLLDPDSDGDGYSDGLEIIEGSDPSNPDSTLSVIPVEEADILEADFDLAEDGFVYGDDVFLGTSRPDYANGIWLASGGFTGGALQVNLGGRDRRNILGMSGGWEKTFTLNGPTEVILSFRYCLTQTSEYESDEFSRVLISIDGTLYGQAFNDYVDEIVGNGNGGTPQTTGWRLFQVNPGTLSEGNHTVIIGGYNNKKTYSNEATEVLIDDVFVIEVAAGGENAPPFAHDQTVTTEKDTAMTLTLSAVDPDGDSLTFSIVTDPGNGFLCDAAPHLTYTPDPDFTGVDTFTFKANDAYADSNVATVTITVTSVNEKPVAFFSGASDGLSCTFDASESYDPDGAVQSYSWDFGDKNTGSGIRIGHTYQTSGSYNVSLTVTDSEGATDTTVQSISINEPGSGMHVGDLDGVGVPSVWWTWRAKVTVTVNDSNNNPVAGATVSGEWSEGTTGDGFCTTGEMGQCTVTSPRIRKSKYTEVFRVDNVTHDALTYEPLENCDPDEDGDGTTITVSRP